MTSITELAKHYDQLASTEVDGLAGVKLHPMTLCHYEQIQSDENELKTAISATNANGWVLTTHRKSLLPITLEPEEHILEAQLWESDKETSWHVTRHNQRLSIQTWKLNQGQEQALSYEFCHLGPQDRPLKYRRLINSEGYIFAAVFTGLKELNP
uniref:hypothetical protein n=1 Tax=Pseudomonadati TaxID=3379134 RepID=UPI004047B27F